MKKYFAKRAYLRFFKKKNIEKNVKMCYTE